MSTQNSDAADRRFYLAEFMNCALALIDIRNYLLSKRSNNDLPLLHPINAFRVALIFMCCLPILAAFEIACFVMFLNPRNLLLPPSEDFSLQ